MGGYDENDLVGDIYWYDTSDCVGGWNQTATGMWLDETDILPNATLGGPEVSF